MKASLLAGMVKRRMVRAHNVEAITDPTILDPARPTDENGNGYQMILTDRYGIGYLIRIERLGRVREPPAKVGPNDIEEL